MEIFGIALLCREEASLEPFARRLAPVGRVSPVTGPGEATPRRHHLYLVEQALLDVGRPSPQGRACALPTVAILDPALPPPALDDPTIDEVVAPADLDSPAFHWRLRRLVARFREPLSMPRLQRPEYAVLQQMFDHSADWFILKDLSHRFLMVSREFADAVRMSPEDIVGRDDLEIGSARASVLGDPESGFPGFWPQDDAVTTSGEAAYEENPDWQEFSHARLYKRTERVPVRNAFGEVVALLVRVTDVTDMLRAEHERNAREAMLQRVTDEMRNARRSKEIAEEAIGAKNRFMAAASHDLRQPMHALGLFLGVLDRRLVNPDDREILEKIQHSCDALNRLFDSLLDISKLDAGIVDVDARHFPVEDLLGNLRDEFSALGARKSLDVSVACSDAVIHSDGVLLGRVLRNLLQNAVVHTWTGSVSVACTRRGRRLLIAVSDTGPGIPAHEHEEIFSEFYQLDNTRAEPARGLGLGLAIVKRIARLLRIELSLRSVPGEGTTFTVAVPLGERAWIGGARVARGLDGLIGRRVLVVDDEPEILDGLRRVLEAFDCEPIVAASVEEAIEALDARGQLPDVIVADYRLRGDERGSDAIATLRRHFGIEFPAIIVTGDTSAERLLQARESGFPLLHKPVQPTELLEVLSALVDRSGPAP